MTEALRGAHIVLGVSGGIAAYKAAFLTRLLVQAGAEVDTVLTHGAHHFVGPATFSGITGRPTKTEVWGQVTADTATDSALAALPHVELGRRADAIVVAPATAHLIARAAAGIADDLLTNVLLVASCPVLLAPAMHTEMWEHPATRANVATLQQRGVHLVGPAVGELAGGDVGEGRMAEPDEILQALQPLLQPTRAPDGRPAGPTRDPDGRPAGPTRALDGRTVVVTAGPTREHLDPVRFISNRSSGKMGFALAREAARRGARVHLVAGPVELPTPAGVDRHDVVSTRDMHEVVVELAANADVVVKAAAVADFRPAEPSSSKVKKEVGPPTVVLERNPDILAELGAARDGDRPVLVGFAAETDQPEAYGRRKLQDKRVDLMVVNDVSAADAGFEVDTNQVLILGRDGRRAEVPLSSKENVARRVWDEIVTLLGRGRGVPSPDASLGSLPAPTSSPEASLG